MIALCRLLKCSPFAPARSSPPPDDLSTYRIAGRIQAARLESRTSNVTHLPTAIFLASEGYPRQVWARGMSRARTMLQTEEYQAPPWAAPLSLTPTERVALAQLPTPIHPWAVPGVPDGVELWVKRDDLTGMELSGNKVRKLEFLLSEALRQGCDSVVTVGGIQSNHCRATAVASRYLGLECHLILRNSAALVDSDPGLVGNLLVDRLVGAHIHQVSKEEYGRFGGAGLAQRLVETLKAAGKNPYYVPVGGSSSLGCWGYLEMIQELQGQIEGLGITDVAMACGSGGTTAGIALGNHLAGMQLKVHAYGVCDDADYFYGYINDLFQGLGATPERVGGRAEDMFRCIQARGAGYAISKEEELRTVRDVALATGIIADPVYTGKAIHGLLQDLQTRPQEWAGRKVLFIHTGGLLGMYDKLSQLQGLVQPLGRSHRMVL